MKNALFSKLPRSIISTGCISQNILESENVSDKSETHLYQHEN